jgi:hypothetical protein
MPKVLADRSIVPESGLGIVQFVGHRDEPNGVRGMGDVSDIRLLPFTPGRFRNDLRIRTTIHDIHDAVPETAADIFPPGRSKLETFLGAG